MWMESCHGGSGGYGGLGFWNPDSPYVDEPNPWRAYERPLLALRNLDEAMQYLAEEAPSLGIVFKLSRLITKPIDILLVDRGCTENPDQAIMNPQLPAILWDAFSVDLHIKESKGKSLIPIIGRQYRTFPEVDKATDGVVIDPSFAGDNVLDSKDGIDFDESLDNVHCMGLNAVSCLIAHTYLHQVLIRHGTAYQIIDPWSTSWYSGIWLHSIPRQNALGDTIGQAYEKGMAEVGIQYLVDQWWWDLNENVCFYGDPDLRVYTPSTEWDPEEKNHWDEEDIKPIRYDEELNLNGHMPFGAINHPHAKEPKTFLQKYFFIILVVIIILILLIALGFIGRRKK